MAKAKVTKNAPAQKPFTLATALTVANTIAKAVGLAVAHVNTSTTRVSVRVQGYRVQQVGIYPVGNSVQISCPYFTAAMRPQGSAYKVLGGYHIITLQTPTAAQVQQLVTTGLQAGKVLAATATPPAK
jgi:hypothetical protein